MKRGFDFRSETARSHFRANGGAEGDRTPDLMTASHALSQLSYGPKCGCRERPMQTSPAFLIQSSNGVIPVRRESFHRLKGSSFK